MDQNLIRKAILGVMDIVRNSGLLVSLATFQVPDGLTAGGFVSASYVDVPGLVNIECTAPPLITGDGIGADEKKSQEEQESDQEFHILLDSYYAVVDDVWRAAGRVVVDGNAFDVVGHEHDSQFQMSRVRVRNATI